MLFSSTRGSVAAPVHVPSSKKKVYDEFVERSTERAKRRRVGDPLSSTTEQGPQVDQDQFSKVLGYVEAGKKEGAKLMCGGERVGDRGYFVAPTVFADVRDDMKIAQEEIFGPVMSIMKFKDMDELVERANQTIYGLAAAVWTRDISKAHQVAKQRPGGHRLGELLRRLRRRSPIWPASSNPESAAKLGEYGLQQYSEIKTVTIKL